LGKTLAVLKALKAQVPQPPDLARSAGNKRQQGSLFFGYFLFAKQKKVTRFMAKNNSTRN
jgi:hypothetical protein